MGCSGSKDDSNDLASAYDRSMEPTGDSQPLAPEFPSSEAAERAEREQRKVHEHAEKASSNEKAKVGHLWASRFGGPMMEQLLEKMPLVDAQYLIALGKAGGVVPRWQLLPEVAKIGPHNKWRLRCWRRESSLPVLVLS